MLPVFITLLTLAAGAANANGLFAPKKDGIDLEALCRNETVSLSRLSHLGSLIQKLDDDHGGECVDNTVAALRDLKAVVEANKVDSCSMQAFGRYRAFYLRYLDTSDQEVKATAALPQSLRNFALAYGVQLSGLCRVNMVRELLDGGSRAVSKGDLELVERLIEPEGPIAALLGSSTNKPDDMVLPGDFLGRTVKNEAGSERVLLKLKTTPVIKNIQTLCRRRFRPVYGPLMIPVAKFADLGFSHRKGVLKEEIQNAYANKDTKDTIGQWTRIVFMCEMFDKIELVQQSVDADSSADNDATMVNIRSRSDDANSDDDDLLSHLETELDNVEEVTFKPNFNVEMPDKIYGTRGQKYAVFGVDTNIDESAKAKSRLLRKALKGIMNDVAKKRYAKIFNAVKRNLGVLKQQSKTKEDVIGGNSNQADIVKYLNDLVDDKLNPDKGVSLIELDNFQSKIYIAVFIMLMVAWFGSLTYFVVLQIMAHSHG